MTTEGLAVELGFFSDLSSPRFVKESITERDTLAARGFVTVCDCVAAAAAISLSLEALDFRLSISLDSQGGLSPNQLTSLLILTPSSVEEEPESLEDDSEKFDVRLPLTIPESFLSDSSLGLGIGTDGTA